MRARCAFLGFCILVPLSYLLAFRPSDETKTDFRVDVGQQKRDAKGDKQGKANPVASGVRSSLQKREAKTDKKGKANPVASGVRSSQGKREAKADKQGKANPVATSAGPTGD